MTFKPARLLVLLLAAAALPVMAQNVAVVNGKPIPSARVDSLLKDIEARGQKDTPELRKQIKDKLVELEILSQEAEKKGLAKGDDFKEKLAFIREQLLAQALVQEHLKTASIKDADINAEYEKVKAQAAKQTEYHARHVLVETEDEAKAIIVKLKGGAKFEDLAKEKSKEPGAKESGGDLGWSAPEGYVKPFSDAMVKLTKGQFTDTPVQTQFGWHVIKLEDTRPAKVPTLEEEKPRLADKLRQKDMEDFLAGLKSKAVVK